VRIVRVKYCKRCTQYCTLTTHTLCETVVLNIALSHLTQNMKMSCILLYLHYCTECYSIKSNISRDSTIFCTKFSYSVCFVTVQYYTKRFSFLCRTWEYIIVNKIFTSCVRRDWITICTIVQVQFPTGSETLCRILLFHDSSLCETVVHIIVLSRLTTVYIFFIMKCIYYTVKTRMCINKWKVAFTRYTNLLSTKLTDYIIHGVSKDNVQGLTICVYYENCAVYCPMDLY
jgi:hypothetical protein